MRRVSKWRKKKKSDPKRPIESYEHKDKQRANNPPVGLVTPDHERIDPPTIIESACKLPSPSGRGVGGEGKKPLDPKLLELSRKLRKDQTDAEKLLWELLRDRGLAGFKFRRQHPVDPYVLDFYCQEARLAIELDGGQHSEDGIKARDEKRIALRAEKGIVVLRFWNNEVLKQTEAVLQSIYDALTPTLSQRERESVGSSQREREFVNNTKREREIEDNSSMDGSTLPPGDSPLHLSPLPPGEGPGVREIEPGAQRLRNQA